MIRTHFFILVFLLNFIVNVQSTAKDIQTQDREQKIAEKLASVAKADEIVQLGLSEDQFFGFYISTRTEETKGVIILVHGMGAHADWPDVILPLRTRLPEFGWSTLSIQMPLLSTDVSVANYGKTLNRAKNRIQAAVDYLHAWEIEQIILLGYSFGAVQVASYLTNVNDQNVKAFVSVSILAQKFIKPEIDTIKLIGEVNVPVLDIYGDEDLFDVRQGIDDRRLAASKNGNGEFSQIELQQAGHYYIGAEQALAQQIQRWLQQFLSVAEQYSEQYHQDSEITP